jgi:hypothetical protein
MRKLFGKRKYEGSIQSGLRQEFELLGERRDQRASALRMKDASRVRIEGNGQRACIELLSPRDDLTDHLLVSAMDTVEVPNGRNSRAEIGGDFRE